MTRLPKDDGPWKWNRGKHSLARSKTENRERNGKRESEQRYAFLHNVPVCLIWTVTPRIPVLMRDWHCGHHVKLNLRHGCALKQSHRKYPRIYCIHVGIYFESVNARFYRKKRMVLAAASRSSSTLR